MKEQLLDFPMREPELLNNGDAVDISGAPFLFHLPNSYIAFRALKDNFDPAEFNYFHEPGLPIKETSFLNNFARTYQNTDNFDRNLATRVCNFLFSVVYSGYDVGCTTCIDTKIDDYSIEFHNQEKSLPSWFRQMEEGISEGKKTGRGFITKNFLQGYEILIESPGDEERTINHIEQAIFSNDGVRIAYYYGPNIFNTHSHSDAIYYFPNSGSPTENPRILRVRIANVGAAAVKAYG
jgi:hypothetical protein